MQIHQIKNPKKNKKSRRIGRGGKRGTYSGRGVKGYYSRSGSKRSPGFIGGGTPLFKRFPKKRGKGLASIHIKTSVVNLGRINESFGSGGKVTPASLLAKGLVRKVGGALPEVKILSDGDFNKKIIFSGCLFSEAARVKIEKAGGTIEK